MMRVQFSEPMADTPTPPPPSPASPTPPQKIDFHIGDEFGTAKRNLPPAGIVFACIAVVAVVIGIFSYVQRSKPQGSGSIDYVNAAEVPDQNMVLVALTVTLRNTGQKPLWIHTVKGQLKTADDKTFDDEAASGVDFERYFQGFPALKENSQPPLPPETKVLPGAEQKGTVIFSFPVTKQAFDQRKTIVLNIQPYDQPLPVVLTK
jgi:hypothetical protein